MSSIQLLAGVGSFGWKENREARKALPQHKDRHEASPPLPQPITKLSEGEIEVNDGEHLGRLFPLGLRRELRELSGAQEVEQ